MTTWWKLCFHESLFNSWNATGRLGTKCYVLLVFRHLLSALLTQSYGGVWAGVVVVWVETREGCSCWQQKRAFGSIEVLPPLLILYLVEGQGSHDYLFFGKNSNIFPSHVNHDCCKEIMFTFKCTASMLHILCFTNACYPGGQLWLV